MADGPTLSGSRLLAEWLVRELVLEHGNLVVIQNEESKNVGSLAPGKRQSRRDNQFSGHTKIIVSVGHRVWSFTTNCSR